MSTLNKVMQIIRHKSGKDPATRDEVQTLTMGLANVLNEHERRLDIMATIMAEIAPEYPYIMEEAKDDDDRRELVRKYMNHNMKYKEM